MLGSDRADSATAAPATPLSPTSADHTAASAVVDLPMDFQTEISALSLRAGASFFQLEAAALSLQASASECLS